jgi:hypothetical protein
MNNFCRQNMSISEALWESPFHAALTLQCTHAAKSALGQKQILQRLMVMSAVMKKLLLHEHPSGVGKTAFSIICQYAKPDILSLSG